MQITISNIFNICLYAIIIIFAMNILVRTGIFKYTKKQKTGYTAELYTQEIDCNGVILTVQVEVTGEEGKRQLQAIKNYWEKEKRIRVTKQSLIGSYELIEGEHDKHTRIEKDSVKYKVTGEDNIDGIITIIGLADEGIDKSNSYSSVATSKDSGYEIAIYPDSPIQRMYS